jgi:hypothetical protein
MNPIELPWFVFEDVRFLGTDSLKYERDSTNLKQMTVDFTFRRIVKTIAVSHTAVNTAADVVDLTLSDKALPYDANNAIMLMPVGIDLASPNSEKRWVNYKWGATSLSEDLTKLKDHLKKWHEKRYANVSTPNNAYNTLMSAINESITKVNEVLANNWASLYNVRLQ